MSVVMRGFPGDLTLADLQTSLQLEEAGGLELFDCIVATDKANQPINICKFQLLAPGEVPKDIVLVKHNTPQPANTGSRLFEDVVVVERQFMHVDFYRQT